MSDHSSSLVVADVTDVAAAAAAMPSAIGGFRLSPQQRRLWGLQAEDGWGYLTTWELAIRGDFDGDRLAGCLAAPVDRYEVLRTSFGSLPGMNMPLQVIAESGEWAIERVDLATLSAPEREEKLAALRRRFARGPRSGLRALAVAVGPGEHRLLFSLPALLCDGEGALALSRFLARELGVAGTEQPAAADDPLQYADLAEWMNDGLEGEGAEVGRERWSRLVRDARSASRWPWEPAARTAKSVEPERHPVALSADLVTALERAAADLGASFSLFAQACWRVLLARHLDSEDSLIAVGFDGRGYEEIENAVGLFVRHLPVACRVEAGQSVAEILPGLSVALGEARQWQESFSWEDLVPESAVRLPYLLASFESFRLPAPSEAAGLRFEVLDLCCVADRSTLQLSVIESATGPRLDLRFDAGRVPQAEVERLAERLTALLASAAAEPGRPSGELDLLGSRQRSLLVTERNATTVERPSTSVWELFAARAERTPEGVALCDGDQVWTYRDLGLRAAAIARRLRAMGVGPEVRVGLRVGRSSPLVAGLLGVLGAGGAYVPLDPSYPPGRLSFLLADAGITVLITSGREVGDLAPGGPLVLDLGDVVEGAPVAESPAIDLDPRHLAYVIYTSGSTGRPKGVMVSHQGLSNYLLWAAEAYPCGPGFASPVHSPLGFDLTVTSLLVPLISGGTVELLPEGTDREAFARAFQKTGVFGLVKLTPAHLELLADQLPGDSVARRTDALVVGGEQLFGETLEQWRKHSPATWVINEYGPTEAVVGCATFRARANDLPSGPVPIGRPIANVRLYVVDRGLELVPEGVPGELLIGGAGVARGYHGRGDLTAERFIPNPFAGLDGDRLYRTGDLVRWGSEGNLEFLGRRDQQVKVRGFRIELGEIETVLREAPGVQEAVAVVREGPGGPSLAAFVVPAEPVPELRLRRLDRENRSAALPRFELPNGLVVFHNNPGETRYLYEELFERQAYLRHGVRLDPGACLFDVGANIGMFSLLVGLSVEGARIYAFEPVPKVCELLRLNTEIYGLEARVFEVGLAERERRVTFDYFPHLTLISGAFADAAAERDLVRRFELLRDQDSGAMLDELLDERLRSEAVDCRLVPLSAMIKETGVDRIDLLKIDVEKGELAVLEGIEPGDWPKIRQIVVEVHDIEGRLDRIREILTGHGFTVEFDQEESLSGSDLYLVFAVRSSTLRSAEAEQHLTPPRVRSLPSWLGEVRQHLERSLPDYMLPAHLLALESLPKSAHGKIDRKALPMIEERPDPKREIELPRTPLEEVLKSLWAEVLGRESFGLHESFFDLGGHSLLVTKLVSRVRQTFSAEIPLHRFFESPTVAGLAATVERSLAGGGRLEVPPITPAPRDRPLPLSFAQGRLWFLDQLAPGSSAYNVNTVVRLAGNLRIPALGRALDELVRRHEMLRTRFASGEDGEPIQIVAPPARLALPAVDLRSLPGEEREVEIRRLAEDHARRPFDLAHDPLLRTWLLHASDREWLLPFTMHHIAGDGWSMGLLVREVVDLYAAFSVGQPSPLPPLAIQYGDYAVWQRRWIAGPTLESQLDYWRRQLDGLPPVLALPLDRPRPAVPSGRGGRDWFEWPVELAVELERVSRGERTTLFMFLLAAYAVVLGHLTGVRDLAVGTNVAHRNRTETEGLIGFFINQLVLRIDLPGDATFRELLATVRQVCVAAYAHQDVPFEKLVEALRPERDLSVAPLIQAKIELQYQAENPTGRQFTDLSMGYLDLDQPSVHGDLHLSLERSLSGLTGSLAYNSDVFDPATAQRILRGFERVVETAAAAPETRVLLLTGLLDEEDRQQAAAELNTLDELSAGKLRRRVRRPALST